MDGTINNAWTEQGNWAGSAVPTNDGHALCFFPQTGVNFGFGESAGESREL